jgi:hypothetical protein
MTAMPKTGAARLGYLTADGHREPSGLCAERSKACSEQSHSIRAPSRGQGQLQHQRTWELGTAGAWGMPSADRVSRNVATKAPSDEKS